MTQSSYLTRRGQLETYFDRTAARAWERLTSDAPVSRIRQSVRAGRDAMREQLLSWLPPNLAGRHVLDAGCGTGALAIALAERGARVTAIDISASLIDVARQRTPDRLAERIDYRVGDMIDNGVVDVDHVVAMDSLIHYAEPDLIVALTGLRTCLNSGNASLLMTFAPRTRALMLMKQVGQRFPRADRSPAIEPIGESRLHSAIARQDKLDGLTWNRTRRIDTLFYKSQALELTLP